MTADVSALHDWGHLDYEEAKTDIWRQLGQLDLEVWGRQVFVAVYTRPAFNHRSKLTFTEREQQKDWIEGKVVLVLAHGPDAFQGAESYIKATYGGSDRVPKVGQWLFQNANTGIQFSFKGDGAERVKYEDRRGEPQNLYPAEGWPVRIVEDDGFLGRIARPTSVV